MNSMDLEKSLSSIFQLDKEIKETEKTDSLTERICSENGRFTAISKNASKTHTLAPLLEDIRNALDQVSENFKKADGSETDLLKISNLEQEIHHIKNWEERTVDRFYLNLNKSFRNILSYIPFSNWREARLNAERVSNEHEKIQERINLIQTQCVMIKDKIAQQQFQTFKNSIENKKTDFVTALQISSEEIQKLMSNTQIGQEEKLYKIANNLGSMRTKVNDLKTFANQLSNNMKETTTYSNEINYLITNKNEITTVRKDINLLLKEIAKLTNAAIYFLEVSLPDETQIFFTPMADPEQKSGDEEPTLVDRIQKNQADATVLIKYCNTLLKDSNKNRGALTLAYVRLQEMLENSKGIMDSSFTNKGVTQKNSSGEEVIKKGIIDKINHENAELKLLNTRFKKLNKEFKFKNFFKIFFGARLKEIQNESSTLKNKISGKQQIIKKCEIEKVLYPVADKSLQEFEVEFNKLSNDLRSHGVIDEKNQPLGEVTIDLTNPVLEGRHTIATSELIKLSEAYRYYTNRLTALQQDCAKASTALSQLDTSIGNTSVPSSPAARKLGL